MIVPYNSIINIVNWTISETNSSVIKTKSK